MPFIYTLGPPNRRKRFSYTGSVTEGVFLEYLDRPQVSADFFNAILHRFAGETLPGGFGMYRTIQGGLGEWVEINSLLMNSVKLTARHASHIAAILWNENYLHSTWMLGNGVILRFNDSHRVK